MIRTFRPVPGLRLALVTLALVAVSAVPGLAQSITAANCRPLATIERSRQQVEAIRADREAGIDRLPTAEHRELANRSLYQWYWARLASFDAQTAQAEAYCRGELLRQEEALTRVAPLPEPAPPDPFASASGNPYRPGYVPPPTAMYPPYPRYPSPMDRPDPFTGPYGAPYTVDPFSPAPRYPVPRVQYGPPPRGWTYPPYRSPWNRLPPYDPRLQPPSSIDPFSPGPVEWR
jgi:hypothetical protein